MYFFASNILLLPRKTTFSISRPDINLTNPNWVENQPFSFDWHCRNYRAQNSCNTTNLLQNYFLSKKHNFITLDESNYLAVNKSRVFSQVKLVGRWKRIVILTMCNISKFQKILDSNNIRIGLSIYVRFSLMFSVFILLRPTYMQQLGEFYFSSLTVLCLILYTYALS